MTQIPVFTSIETFSQISTFESFVFTFYLNEHIKTQKNHACTNESNNVSLHRRFDTQSARWYYLQGNLVGVRKEPNRKMDFIKWCCTFWNPFIFILCRGNACTY